MGKVVYNACFGGFGLSDAAIQRYAELKGLTLYPEGSSWHKTWWTVPPGQRPDPLEGTAWHAATEDEKRAYNEAYDRLAIYDIQRTDPHLIQAVEELGDLTNGEFALLRIAELPSGAAYRIDHYDGHETVETHDTYDWQVVP